MAKIILKIVRWLFFGVLLALVPLGYAYISLLIKNKSPTFEGILADGGLLLIVSSFCAGALGEMIGSTTAYGLYKIICAGTTMILLLLSAMVFASIVEARLTNQVNESVIQSISMIVFVSALVSSAACIALSET